jgi:hypothetical protein
MKVRLQQTTDNLPNPVEREPLPDDHHIPDSVLPENRFVGRSEVGNRLREIRKDLEASVRSRDTDGAARCKRDVIEAGLN